MEMIVGFMLVNIIENYSLLFSFIENLFIFCIFVYVELDILDSF